MSLINSCGVLVNDNPYLVFGGIQPKFLSMMSAQDAATTVRLHFIFLMFSFINVL